MIVNFGLRRTLGSVGYPTFWAPFTDSGSGVLNTTLSRGTGSITWTRAGATATTILSSGLVSSTIAANTGRSYYDPAPVGATAGYMYLPGVSGSYASTPDTSAVSITGDIDIRVQVALADYTPATKQNLVAKDDSGSNRSYLFELNTTGFLEFTVYTTGAAGSAILATSSAAVAFSDGAIGGIRVTRNVTTGDVVFYTSTDFSTWTQLGTTQSTAAGAAFDGNAVVGVGARNSGTGNMSTGRIYRAQLYNGINGTLVADFNPARTTQGQTSFAATTGETWTMNGRSYLYALPEYRGGVIEEARDNVVLQSSNFGTTWVAVGTPTRSAAAKTCGSVNLDLIGDDSAAALEGYTQTITYTGNATKVVSIFVAQDTSTSTMVRLRDTTAPADRLLGAITWSAGAPTLTMTTGTHLGSQPFPDGVWRISFLTSAVTAANVNSLEVYPASDAALTVTNTGNIYAGGVESNNATFSTTHIPTTTASVTRAADVPSISSTGNLVVGQGTVFAKVTAFDVSAGRTVLSISDGTNNNTVNLLTSTVARMQTISGGVTQADMTVAGAAANVEQREAAVWNTNISNVYRNGTPGTLDTTVTVPASFTTIYLGCTGAGVNGLGAGCLRDLRGWQRVLSDSQIASIR